MWSFIQIFFQVEKRGSSKLLGVGLQLRALVSATVAVIAKVLQCLLVFYSQSERDNRGRRSSES